MKDTDHTSKPTGFIPDLTPALSPVPPKRIETAKHYIYQEPRITAAKLSEYAVASPARQRTIVQNAKIAPKVQLSYYREVRDIFSTSYGHDGINADFLARKAKEIEERKPESSWQEEENPRCAGALKHLSRVVREMECSGGNAIHRPQRGWGGFRIAGVYVSINPELVFSIPHRGVRKTGGVILNTGQDASLSLDRSHDGHSVGDYLSTLLYRLLEARGGVPLHTRCYAIDVARETSYSAPSAHKRLLKNLEAACEMIALRWESIDVSSLTDVAASEEDA